jgi:probable phosphoglycerate mutase
MRLVLARHGQTPSNVKQKLDTLPPGPPLTEEGRQQALELATALADERIAAVYASTAVRAQQTAEPVATKLGLPVTVVDGIQEISVGDLEGRNDLDALRQFHDVYIRWADGELMARAPGGESAQDVIDRYRGALDGLISRHADDTITVVSHGAAIRLVATYFARNIDADLGARAMLPNTGYVVLEHTGDEWQCLSWTGVQLG